MQPALELRPLGVGDIVDRVFAIYRSRLLPLLAIAAIPYLSLVLVLVGLTVAFGGTFVALAPLLGGDLDRSATLILSVLGGVLAFLGLVVAAALLTTLVQSAALVDAVAARYMARERTVGTSLLTGLRAAPRLFAMGILALLAFLLLWIVAVVVVALVRQWWAFLFGGLGTVFLSAYIAASWMVSPAVAILEGGGPVAALRRSWHLAEGDRWRILGLIALLGVLQVVLSSLLSFVLIASLGADQLVQIVLQQAMNLLASIAWAPVYWGTFTVLYYDLRVRKEALDLQLAVEALPRAT